MRSLGDGRTLPDRVRRTTLTHPLVGIAAGALAVAVVTGAIAALDGFVPVLSLGVLYVFAVLPIAVFWGTVVAIPVAIASMLAFNFFFLPPIYTLTLADRSNWFALAVYVVTAIVVGSLASRYRSRGAEAEQREREAALLADIAAELLGGTGLEQELGRIEERTASVLGVSTVRIVLGDKARTPAHEAPYDLTVDGRPVGALYTPETEEPALATRRRLLPALASLLAVAREREALTREAFEAETLRKSDTIKTAVIQAVSHDLRTPLATIEQALDGLESGELALTEDDRTALLETIRVEHMRLKRLVENLLDLSRLQARAAETRPELWAAEDLVAQALDELGGGERVTVSAPPDLPPVRVDATQVQRALVNLLENALRYAPAGESVHVRLTMTRKDVLIRITDTGPGIPEDERDRVFEPFHRVAGRPEEPGAGLGLAIARGFAEANGGRLWLETREGQGASFVSRCRSSSFLRRSQHDNRPARARRRRRAAVPSSAPDEPPRRGLRRPHRDNGRGGAERRGAAAAGGDHPRSAASRRARDRGRSRAAPLDRGPDHPRLRGGRRGGEDRRARCRSRRLRDEAVRDRRAPRPPARSPAARRARAEPTLTIGELELDLEKRSVSMAGQPVHLTPHEFELLRVLAQNEGKLMTHKAILQAVWGPAYQRESSYLHVFVSQLRRKLEPDPARPRYILTEPGAGYRLVEPESLEHP